MEGKNVLFITPNDIYDMYGNGGVKGSQKNYMLVEQCFGKEHTFLCTFFKPNNNDSCKCFSFQRAKSSIGQLIAALFGCKVYFPWTEKEIENLIKSLNIDLLFIDSSVLGRLVRIKGAYKTIVFYHNIETDYARNKVKNEGIKYLPSYLASKYNDKCGIRANKVMCLSEHDSERLYELYQRKADFLIPVSFTDVFDAQKTHNNYERRLLFLGSLFPPNQISIEWFIREVMPKLDNIGLDIVGKNFEQKRDEYEKTIGIKVIGSVQDLSSYYYSHAAVVLPILHGAGMKVKTAEAMMYGRRIFASDEALVGYDITGVPGITRCNTADEYAEAINLYFNFEGMMCYQKDVRDRYVEKYSTACIKEKFCLFIRQFLNA